jgi:hypothetical protein
MYMELRGKRNTIIVNEECKLSLIDDWTAALK